MSVERAGQRLGRLIAPAYRRITGALDSAPYHVKYNAAVVAAFLFSVGLWLLAAYGVGVIFNRLLGFNLLATSACFVVLNVAFWSRFSDQPLPDLRRVLRLRLLRKE